MAGGGSRLILSGSKGGRLSILALAARARGAHMHLPGERQSVSISRRGSAGEYIGGAKQWVVVLRGVEFGGGKGWDLSISGAASRRKWIGTRAEGGLVEGKNSNGSGKRSERARLVSMVVG